MFILIPFLKRNNKYFKIYVLFILLIFYSIIYAFLPDLHLKHISKEQNTHTFIKKKNGFNIKNIIYYFYVSVIIQSTVGLGDIIPTTSLSKLIVSTQALTTLITVLI